MNGFFYYNLQLKDKIKCRFSPTLSSFIMGNCNTKCTQGDQCTLLLPSLLQPKITSWASLKRCKLHTGGTQPEAVSNEIIARRERVKQLVLAVHWISTTQLHFVRKTDLLMENFIPMLSVFGWVTMEFTIYYKINWQRSISYLLSRSSRKL